ncbi:MAG: HlyC/CorC family transporter, partial [Ignavibacteriales bacterium]
NGFLAMSEIAFVSVKRFKLEEKAKKGNRSAEKALLLLQEPEKFLSAIQVGITLIGILAGAFGGYALAEDLAPYIARADYLKEYASEISFALVVSVITYLSLVIGELVPKRIAMNNPERVTLIMVSPMYFITRAFTPIVSFLSVSTKFLLMIIRIKKTENVSVTEDEVKSLLEIGTLHGVFEKEESEIIKKIFSFNDKRVSALMVPRKDIQWINSAMSNREIFEFISTHNYSRYVVGENNIDNLVGMIISKKFLLEYNKNPEVDISSIIDEILIVPESNYSIDLIEKFRQQKTNMAVVVDEFGGTQGLITLHDLIENIIGEFPESFEEVSQKIIKRKDGSYLLDGLTEISRISELLGIIFLPDDYKTLGGFIMHKLGKIPEEGDKVLYQNYIFEVIDMDDKRVDKVLLIRKD